MNPSAVRVDTFTPVFDAVVQDIGLVGASIYGRIWRYCQGAHQCCDAAQATIAEQLNLSLRTVQRWIAKLVQAGYLEDLAPNLKNKPHAYTVTDKLRLVVEIRSECATTESHSATTESHSATTESHSHYDRESHEETRNETPKKQEKIDPAAGAAGTPAQQRLAEMRARLGTDPFSLAASTVRAQEEAGGRIWTVPIDAGGTDGAGALMLNAWLASKQLDPDVVPDKTQANFRASLSKLAESLEGITPEQAARAVEIVLDTDNDEFNYYTYTDPVVLKFKRDWADVALRLLSGQSGYLTARDPPCDAPTVNVSGALPEAELPTELDQLWSRCLAELRMQCTADMYARWYAGTRLVALEEGMATLVVRDEYAADWIAQRLARQVTGVLGQMIESGDLALTCRTGTA